MKNNTLGATLKNMDPTTTVYIFTADGDCILPSKRVVSVIKNEAFTAIYFDWEIVDIRTARSSTTIIINRRTV